MSVNRYKDGQLTLIAGSGDSNTFTGTKAEVEQAIAAGKIKENWTVYITDDLEDIVNPSGSNCDCKVEYITQEDYDALPEDKLTNNIEYRITDNNPATPSAKNMAYDSSASGIAAVNVQDAIDAVSGGLEWKLLHDFTSVGESFDISNLSYNELELTGIVDGYRTIVRVSKRTINECNQGYGIALPSMAAAVNYRKNWCIFKINQTSITLSEYLSENNIFPITVNYR